MRPFAFLLAMLIVVPVAGLCEDWPVATVKSPPAPVTVVPVAEKHVARQVNPVGSVEAVESSIVAAEVVGGLPISNEFTIFLTPAI